MGNCDLCKYWIEIEDDRGQCMRYPPTVVNMGASVKYKAGLQSFHPIVNALNCCGEWQKNEG